MRQGGPLELLPADYQPIRLRAVLNDHGISQRDLAAQVTLANGKTISTAALNRLLGFDVWPVRTDPASIRHQVEMALTGHGVSPEVIATVWQPAPRATQSLNHRGRMLVVPERIQFISQFHDLLTEPAMLSTDAKQQFGLTHSPFVDDIDGEGDIYTNKNIVYARNAMWNTCKLGGFIAVVGESGAGKSTLRKWLLDRIERESAQIRVIQPRVFNKDRLTGGQLCEAILADLGHEGRQPRSLEAKARLVERMLIASLQGGNKHVLVIEEAHDLTVGFLKLLKRFLELEKGFKRLLSIVLIGQPELLDKLNERLHPEAREVIRRVEIVNLPALDTDVKGYLALKFKRVGVGLDSVFATDAFDGITNRLTERGRNNTVNSMCYPLTINNLVIKALNKAAELKLPKVTAQIVAQL
ncbi:MAG: AAA family ATPase [Betaproteobacteria bacterium]|nr:AAA family ATPase [Betaproteobacteria bacterium]